MPEAAATRTDPADFECLGRLLGEIAVAKDIRSVVVAGIDGTDTTAACAALRAAARRLDFCPGPDTLPATLAVSGALLRTPADAVRAGHAFAARRTSANCRLALVASTALLVGLRRESPYLNALDSLCDRLSGVIGRLCLVETVMSVPGAEDRQVCVLRVLK